MTLDMSDPGMMGGKPGTGHCSRLTGSLLGGKHGFSRLIQSWNCAHHEFLHKLGMALSQTDIHSLIVPSLSVFRSLYSRFLSS